jgi:hypothetical protein
MLEMDAAPAPGEVLLRIVHVNDVYQLEGPRVAILHLFWFLSSCLIYHDYHYLYTL